MRRLLPLILLLLPAAASAGQPPPPCGWQLPAFLGDNHEPHGDPVTITVAEGAPIVLPGIFSGERSLCDPNRHFLAWSLRDADGFERSGAQVPSFAHAVSGGEAAVLWRPEEPLEPGTYSLAIGYTTDLHFYGDNVELSHELDVIVTGPQGWELTLGPERQYGRRQDRDNVCCPDQGYEMCGAQTCTYRDLTVDATWELRADADRERLAGRELRYTLETMHPEQGMDFVTARASISRIPTRSVPVTFSYDPITIPQEICMRLVLSVDEPLEVLDVTPWRCETTPILEAADACVVEDPLTCPQDLAPIPIEDVEPLPDTVLPDEGPRRTEVRAAGCGGCATTPRAPTSWLGLFLLGALGLRRRRPE